jgi:hypothetical protein
MPQPPFDAAALCDETGGAADPPGDAGIPPVEGADPPTGWLGAEGCCCGAGPSAARAPACCWGAGLSAAALTSGCGRSACWTWSALGRGPSDCWAGSTDRRSGS